MQSFLSQQGITTRQASNTTVNGLTAAAATFDATTQQGALQGRALTVAHNGQTYLLLGLMVPQATATRAPEIDGVFRSFRALTDANALNKQPVKVELVTLDQAMTGAQFVQRYPSSVSAEQVYIANVVKCRPPQNRTPEPKEANTCSPFLLQQVDIVQPKVIVALGATAATYLLGVKQSLANLRGQWHDVRGAKCAVTYHPAFLLRDPRQKGEAWKDLQRVMVELGLKPPTRG